jgi:hypothetical protein
MVIQWDTVALFCIMAASGFFGGMISSILDHMYEKPPTAKIAPIAVPGFCFVAGSSGWPDLRWWCFFGYGWTR